MTEQAVFDLEVKQGATLRQTFVYTVPTVADPTVYEPSSLAGYKVRMQIRSRQSKSAPVLLTVLSDSSDPDYNSHAYITVEPGSETGRIDVFLGATQTAQLERNGFYDLELHLVADPDEVIALVGGAVLVEPEVTE